MGWSSGYDYFDGALDTFFHYVPDEAKESVISEWYKVFKYTDWDTQKESNYFEPWLKNEMIRLGELDVCPTCNDIEYDFYKGEGHCYNEQCPDSKYYEAPQD